MWELSLVSWATLPLILTMSNLKQQLRESNTGFSNPLNLRHLSVIAFVFSAMKLGRA
jgi:hypothetical protein